MIKARRERLAAEAVRRYESGEAGSVIAADLEVTKPTIYKWVRAAGGHVRTARENSPVRSDIKRVAERYCAGEPLKDIAADYGTVKQVVCTALRACGYKLDRWQPAPPRQHTRTPKAYGCTVEEFTAIDNGENSAKYISHKKGARYRGIEWQFTFPEWWAMWEESGVWDQRAKGGYCMARFNDAGPYAFWNVEIITQAENTRDAHRNHAKRGLTVPSRDKAAQARVAELQQRVSA